jgi:hypothetical protein
MRNDLRAREAWKCGKGWQRSHKRVQTVRMNIDIICMRFLRLGLMFMGIYASVLELCECTHHTECACCRTTVLAARLQEVLATRRTPKCLNFKKNSFLKHIVALLSKSEGLQTWLAPCGTDMHSAAHTIDVHVLPLYS